MSNGNQWLRLWHDMPNDPKWRTIARISKQRIGDVISVYLHVLVDASSNATERGRTHGVCVEDVATALDLNEDQVEAILSAMQGRVLNDDKVTGWEKRQPIREDGSSERAKAWRERRKIEEEQRRTQQNAPELQDKNREDKKKNPPNPPAGGESPKPEKPKRERKPRTTLKTFVRACSQAGEKPISGYRPLLEYVQASGLPMEFVQLAWEVFKGEFMPGGSNENRLQADWRRHFLNYVKKGFLRLWYAKPAGEDGRAEYHLSTQGMQAKAACAHREAA